MLQEHSHIPDHNKEIYDPTRFGTVLTLRERGSASEMSREFEFARSHGFIKPDFDLKSYAQLRDAQDRWAGMGKSRPEGVLVNYSPNPAISEPSYLELLGPSEILELRKKRSPNFLLAGSSTLESAEGMLKLAKKINPGSQLEILDLHTRHLSGLHEEDLKITEADLLHSPDTQRQYDCIATNNILYWLEGTQNKKEDVALLMKNLSQALNPGGNLLLYETKNGGADFDVLNDNYITELLRTLNLGKMAELSKALIYNFPDQNSQAPIQENGTANYKDICLREAWVGITCARFKK